MSNGLPSDDLEEIASRFSSLLRLLTHDGKGNRPPETQTMLIDRIRDALDRRLPHFPSDNPIFIAGSFLIEETVHRHECTEISRLRHRDLGTLHALKTVTPSHANDVGARRLLLREAEIGMALHHPHIARTQIALRLPDGRPAIVMEWAGVPLSRRLAAGAISARDIVEMMSGLLSGLQAIHEAGYVHCDITPANLLLPDNDFRGLKIADFGVALKQGGRNRDLEIKMAGTPPFMAPEQADGAAADLRSDLYSAGRVLHVLLDGCEETGDDVENISAFAEHLTRPDPSMRPASAAAALGLLGTLSADPLRSF
ncbi:serine/threonine-protein kinase [Rhizobium sp. CNPSo 3464]|uniref:serine/threonine-protein kinase n=1 Tax=Rhizobium sp. CNPSo 3464 TaxID=3021406 RepID=UPI00254DC3DE|nr:serine/threonine-protein kinase [Rhizobium sp. CNPSo 3464]MDK4741188.1 serine/threonine-protein kinase [Rhizobium sp. CNPSo 3464]